MTDILTNLAVFLAGAGTSAAIGCALRRAVAHETQAVRRRS